MVGRLIPRVALIAAGLLMAADAQAQGVSPAACSDLAGMTLPARALGLPTSGATVTSAEAAGGGTYCKVLGTIAPVDPSAPAIRFEVDLPARWNGEALMFGGGGFDGTIPAVAGGYAVGPAGSLTPLIQGYATFGSDSGHQASTTETPVTATDGAFARNDEALRNYAGDAVKKTRDAAMGVIVAHYGRPPSRTYFIGGSNGGREGLLAIQRWPADFDGAVIAYPWRAAGTTILAYGRVMRAFATPGAYPSPRQQALLVQAVVDRCDALDGLADGVVSNVEACAFDPDVLRCPAGAAAGADCLSEAQIAALRAYDQVSSYPGVQGEDRAHPGFPVFAGADLRGPQQLNAVQPAYPPTRDMPTVAHMWGQFARYFVARDPGYDPGALDPEAPGVMTARVREVVSQLNVPMTDFAGFRARGGKLLIVHGLADALVSHRSTNLYWARLREMMGDRALKGFARYYTVPGFGHGAGGSNSFTAAWDSLPVLDRWVGRGVAPGAQIVADTGPQARARTRPLCEYPLWPKYRSGPPDAAASFVCARR